MSHEIIKIGQLEIRYMLDGACHGGLGLFELTIPANANVPPPHSHSDNEECVYVLEEILRYRVNDETRDLEPGQWMSTHRGAVHAFSNPGTEIARALVMLTPDIGAQFFRDVSEEANTGSAPDREKLLGVMTRYGLVPAVSKVTPSPMTV